MDFLEEENEKSTMANAGHYGSDSGAAWVREKAGCAGAQFGKQPEFFNRRAGHSDVRLGFKKGDSIQARKRRRAQAGELIGERRRERQ